MIQATINKLFKSTHNNNKYVFIYSPPKVGSTTLTTSLRVSLGNTYNIVHIHDEIMLNVLTGISGISINDIIRFLSDLGKTVYVIDIYRTPIERKMSEFFEKLSPYHFNNTEDNIAATYSMSKIINRFNRLFPHIENGDHYHDCYNIVNPVPFDFNKKYTHEIVHNVNYIKLRLCDVSMWPIILSTIFNSEIVIINDYITCSKKSIGALYEQFKAEYTIPYNYLERIKQDTYLHIYYSESERNNYIQHWTNKMSNISAIPYTVPEYTFYITLCLENQHIVDIHSDHYIDNGCICKPCSQQRTLLYTTTKAGKQPSKLKITHPQTTLTTQYRFIGNKYAKQMFKIRNL